MAELTFEGLFARQKRWSEKTFGGRGDRGPAGSLKHLAKEVDEALAAPDDPSEYADLLILVIDAAWRAGLSPKKLLSAVDAKLKVNRKREWPAPTPDAPVEHKK